MHNKLQSNTYGLLFIMANDFASRSQPINFFRSRRLYDRRSIWHIFTNLNDKLDGGQGLSAYITVAVSASGEI